MTTETASATPVVAPRMPAAKNDVCLPGVQSDDAGVARNAGMLDVHVVTARASGFLIRRPRTECDVARAYRKLRQSVKADCDVVATGIVQHQRVLPIATLANPSCCRTWRGRLWRH